MKKILPLIAVIVLLVALGPEGYERYREWSRTDQARKRVEWMFRGKVSGDEQLALCQWERGKVVMPMSDIEAALPDWQSFWRSSGFGDGRGWEVSSKRVVDGLRVEVVVVKGDDQRRLVVRDDEPIEIVWPD